MIWDDPWLLAPLSGPPPAPPELPAGMVFRCLQVCDMSGTLLLQWRDLVGTRWSISALQERLAGAWVALLYDSGGRGPVATCVLRPRGSTIWLLETFVARPQGSGFGTLLMRHALPWVWAQGCRSLIYTWELGPVGLAAAWWRGWLRTTASYEWGWVLRRDSTGCSFCPETRDASGSQFITPVLIRSTQHNGPWAIVSDSGLGDGWGYVLMTAGAVDWQTVFQKGGWRALWYRGDSAPTGTDWKWTGEIVVTGVIGRTPPSTVMQHLRLSPEIAHS
jgi:GNAT superfamily N-acetyltransferase